MGAQAYAQPDFGRFNGVAVWLARTHGDGGEIERVESIEIEMIRESRAEASATSEPSLRLPDDLARALLDALVAHYGGHQHLRSLRSDYDAERRRVDRFIEHLTRGA